jgi:hypothetical protein
MIPTFSQLTYSARILNQTRKDLLNKKMFNPNAEIYLQDQQMLKAATWNYATEPIKEYSCPRCSLTIKCPRAWIVQHTKTHFDIMARKENEVFVDKVQTYF